MIFNPYLQTTPEKHVDALLYKTHKEDKALDAEA
jgi:hypothetical protein